VSLPEISYDAVPYVQAWPGMIEYFDPQGDKQTLFFQCNPTSLTRSRTITRVDSKAGNPAEGTTQQRGKVGRKFSHKPTPWTFEGLELLFDASMPYLLSSYVFAPEGEHLGFGIKHPQNLIDIREAIKHVEAISEPGPVRTENASQQGAPPAPSQPLITLTLGRRQWQGYVNSVTIAEKDFTPDLVPRQVKVTLGLELTLTHADLDLGKTGGTKTA
jgi:hypothetical protein